MTVQEPERAHAVLSPSSAERWISCPASVRVGQEIALTAVDKGTSPYAVEGTIAHALAELRARHEILGEGTEEEFQAQLLAWREEHSVYDPAIEAEMHTHVDAYVALLVERLERHPNSQLLLEQRVPTGVPSCWGTSDAVIVSTVHVEIIDFKYGQGVAVSAWDNPQIMLYGVGALEMFGDVLGDTETVYMTIHQPRLDYLSTFDKPASELREWRDGLLPVAEEALGDNARFGPSEDACRWCPAAGMCRAQLEHATQLDFGRPSDLLTPDELAEALEIIPAIEKWCSAVRDVALDLAYSGGTPIPNHKVVLSGGKRYITDPDAALNLLVDNGFAEDDVSRRTLKGIGDLEKLLGKAQMTEVLGDVTGKTPGKPALVHESDKRPAISPDSEAVKEFGEGVATNEGEA